MLWNIETADHNVITGWIYDERRPDATMEVIAVLGDRIAGRAMATAPRPHLAQRGHAKSDCGFSIPLPEENAANTRLLCLSGGRDSQTIVIYSPVKEEIGKVVPPYQSFLQESRADAPEGASNSAQKLAALALPPLAGASVLDLGCNEGFFCMQAWLSGAKRVLGIDSSELFIERAKARTVGCGDSAGSDASGRSLEFRCASWWDVPDEKFDVILFLSAIHYEEKQKQLLDFLRSRLAPGGTLILECGVAEGAGENWKTVKRSIDARRFPTKKYLIGTLLDKYVARLVTNSPAQRGDPIPRMVFHCTAKNSVAGVIRGASGKGKTTLAQLVAQRGLSVFSSDVFLRSAIKDENRFVPESPLYDMLTRELTTFTLNQAAGKIIAAGAEEEFCRDVVSCLPLDQPLFFVEGEIFTNEAMFAGLKRELEKQNVVVWSIDRA